MEVVLNHQMKIYLITLTFALTANCDNRGYG